MSSGDFGVQKTDIEERQSFQDLKKKYNGLGLWYVRFVVAISLKHQKRRGPKSYYFLVGKGLWHKISSLSGRLEIQKKIDKIKTSYKKDYFFRPYPRASNSWGFEILRGPTVCFNLFVIWLILRVSPDLTENKNPYIKGNQNWLIMQAF